MALLTEGGTLVPACLYKHDPPHGGQGDSHYGRSIGYGKRKQTGAPVLIIPRVFRLRRRRRLDAAFSCLLKRIRKLNQPRLATGQPREAHPAEETETRRRGEGAKRRRGEEEKRRRGEGEKGSYELGG